MRNDTVNALTVDLEDWYHVCDAEESADPSQWDAYESRVLKNTEKILSLFRTHEAKATFFVLGYIASKEPDLIKTIKKEGHEIATHGFYHRVISEMTEHEFETDVAQSIDAISSLTEEKVLGFRAPEWSIRKETPWALKTLRKLGILYDSSMVPLTRMGSRDFPLHPSRFSTDFGDIWEFPLTTTRFLWEHVPFTGGLPLRIAPYCYVVSKIKRMNREHHPALVYVHPWEFDKVKPTLNGLSRSKLFLHYFNISSAPKKVEGLLKHLRFTTIKDALGLQP